MICQSAIDELQEDEEEPVENPGETPSTTDVGESNKEQNLEDNVAKEAMEAEPVFMTRSCRVGKKPNIYVLVNKISQKDWKEEATDKALRQN